jgi:hypothetical protein
MKGLFCFQVSFIGQSMDIWIRQIWDMTSKLGLNIPLKALEWSHLFISLG